MGEEVKLRRNLLIPHDIKIKIKKIGGKI